MSTMFIADIHLCAEKPEITTGFLHFLRTRAIMAQSLYILGDLFEFWIGDDDPNPLHHEVSIALKELNQRNIPCYFIHGNRDFLLGKEYATTCGITILPSQLVIQIDSLKIVILHGDTLCTDDDQYQRFRRLVHNRWLQRIFLSMPLRLRLRIADKIRINSLKENFIKDADIMNVNLQAVITVLNNTRSTLMIHGHTHWAGIHYLPGKRYRAVLNAWHQHGSAIEISSGSIIMHDFPFK